MSNFSGGEPWRGEQGDLIAVRDSRGTLHLAQVGLVYTTPAEIRDNVTAPDKGDGYHPAYFSDHPGAFAPLDAASDPFELLDTGLWYLPPLMSSLRLALSYMSVEGRARLEKVLDRVSNSPGSFITELGGELAPKAGLWWLRGTTFKIELKYGDRLPTYYETILPGYSEPFSNWDLPDEAAQGPTAD